MARTPKPLTSHPPLARRARRLDSGTDGGVDLGPAELWTTEQVADYLSVPVRTLYRWHYVGNGPVPFTIGKYLRYDPAEVRRWVMAQR